MFSFCWILRTRALAQSMTEAYSEIPRHFHCWNQESWKLKVKAAQSCPTLCGSMDYTIRGILQARTLEWVPFPFSRGSSQPRDRTQVSCIAGGFFTSWATGEAVISPHMPILTTQTLFDSWFSEKRKLTLFLIPSFLTSALVLEICCCC